MKPNEHKQVAELLEAMVAEVFPDHYQPNQLRYVEGITQHLMMGDTIYVDNELNGFFIIKDVTDIVTPSLVLYEGVRLYIKPHKRNGKLLAEFYAKMFEDFTDGEIIGITEIESKHIPVLEKRHTRIANVYKLNRS